MAHSHGVIKKGSHPVDLPQFKGQDDGKTVELLWGPGTDRTNHKYIRVRFKSFRVDPRDGRLKSDWDFDPSAIKLV